MYFTPPTEAVPLELGTGARVKKTRDGASRPRKKFDDIFSRVDTIHQRDGRTDRRTDTGRQQRPRLCIASRGKNCQIIRMSVRIFPSFFFYFLLPEMKTPEFVSSY